MSNEYKGHLICVSRGEFMNSCCTWPSDRVNLWPTWSPGFVPGDIARASIYHIAPNDHMTSTDQQGSASARVWTSTPLNLHYERNLVKSCLVGCTDEYQDLKRAIIEEWDIPEATHEERTTWPVNLAWPSTDLEEDGSGIDFELISRGTMQKVANSE